MNRLHFTMGQHPAARPQHPTRSLRHASGFTLLELLISMVVMFLFIGAAVPSFGKLLKNNRLEAEQMDLMAAIALTRSEAAKRGVPVMLSAMTPVATGNEYGNGWVVWVDKNGDGLYDPATETIRVHQALSSEVKISSATTEIAFLPSGFRRYQDASGNVIQAVFSVCDERHNSPGSQITVLPSGSTSLNNQYVCQ